MLSLEIRAKRFKLNKDKVVADIQSQLELCAKRAYKAFIITALRLAPVDTGMLAGSFLRLSSQLRIAFNKPMVRTHPRYRGQPARKNIRYINRGREGHRRYKSPQLGSYLTIGGRSAGGVIGARAGQEIIRWDGNVLQIRFNTSIKHATLNAEYLRGIEAGRLEFGRVFRAETAKIKSLLKAIVTSSTEITYTTVDEDGNLIKGGDKMPGVL